MNIIIGFMSLGMLIPCVIIGVIMAHEIMSESKILGVIMYIIVTLLLFITSIVILKTLTLVGLI